MQDDERDHADEFDLVGLGAHGGQVGVAMVGVEPVPQGLDATAKIEFNRVHKLKTSCLLAGISSEGELWMHLI